jgi:hypothetical protein
MISGSAAERDIRAADKSWQLFRARIGSQVL